MATVVVYATGDSRNARLKEEQEKSVTLSSGQKVDVLPDAGRTLSKVKVSVAGSTDGVKYTLENGVLSIR